MTNIDVALHQQLAAQFADRFIRGERFETIVAVRNLAESILNEKILPGTPAAKLVDESVEQGVVWAARQLVYQASNPLESWEQCLDLYDRQPPLTTRTSTSVLQQAYSTPIPIAYLAAQLARINQETTIYEPTAGNGSLLILGNPSKAIVNEVNPNRAAALRVQGFTVTQRDASVFLPQIELVDRVIANPPFGSLKDGQGRTRIFRRGALTTSSLDHAIALLALDLMKADGRAVLILGGKMGDERSRTERYNTQLTRGFYRWLYKDGGYKVTDHFSVAGSLYRKQGTTFPIDVIVIEGKGETQLLLPGVSPPRIYESYADLKEVLVHAIEQQQRDEPNQNFGTTLQRIHTGAALDTATTIRILRTTAISVDDGVSPKTVEADRNSAGILFPTDATSGMANRARHRRLEENIRRAGGNRSPVLDRQTNNGVSTNIRQQPGSQLKYEANGTAGSDGLSGTTDAVLPDLGTAVSSDSLPRTRDRLEFNDEHESDRLAGVDEYGSEPALFSGLSTMSDAKEAIEVESPQIQEVALLNQVDYKPRSRAMSLGTLAPAASLKGLENVFNKIETTTGLSIDEYVCSRLGERSTADLFEHYAAEQIDSLGLAIYNHEYENKATLVGHDTGIGKTRIVCGLARYAKEHGMIPTIVTADPVLYSDILARDAVDTGNSFNPLITNNDFNLSLNSSDGNPFGRIRTSKNQIEKIRQFTLAGNIGEHDCVFTTYGQLTGPSSVERRQLLEAIAPHSFLILDESHKAGGAAAEQRPKSQVEQARVARGDSIPSCTEFFQQLVTRTQGFVASSATAIKDPIIAARLFYETTDLKLAAPDRDTFTSHLKAGGVPLQQMVFAMWAESGGCIRCEKSYEGIEFGVAKVPVSLPRAENNSRILNLIWQFDQVKSEVVKEISSDLAQAGEVAKDNNPGLGDAGASSTNFTSVLHNLTAVTSLGLKAQATANEVIKDIEQGRKPIIMLFNTMESAIKNFIDTHNDLVDTHNATSADTPMKRIEVGDAVSINAGELFTRYLQKSRSIKITEPYLDELTGKQITRTHRLTDEELGVVGVAAYNRAKSAIAAADWNSLPISPIDYIKQKVLDAGYSIGEITGRTHILKYDSADNNTSSVVTYSTREHGTAQKKRVMDDFQNGGVDALITNSTTGYSLHAARTVADQRQRVMYILQPHLDVNQVEQTFGRSHRSGQLDPAKHPPDRLDELGQPMWGQYSGTFGLPAFKLVVGENLPTEERAVAVLMKKMAHLKANTTGNRSSSFGLKDMPDFINDYGNEVAANLMEQNPDLHADLDYPLLGGDEELSRDKAIQKVTGRIVMLTSDEPPTPQQPYPSLARQAWLYDTLSLEYKEFLAQKIALGENELEAQKLDLQAEPVSRLILNPGDANVDSPFTKPAYLVEVQAKTGAKPNTTLQVVNAIRTQLGFEAIDEESDHNYAQQSDVREKGKQVAGATAEQLLDWSRAFFDQTTQEHESGLRGVRDRKDKYQERLDVELATQTHLQQRYNDAKASTDIPLSDQLKTQIEQLQPKIDKLSKQLSKVKLELNGREFQLKKEQRLIKTTLHDATDLLSKFPAGQGVRLLDNDTKNFLYGVVAAVEYKGRAKNPAAPANWKLKLLVVDGVRSICVRFDSLLKGGKHHLEPVETAASFLDFRRQSSIYELFDERQTEAREKRYLVSGQVLSAQLTGKFAQVTDNLGQVHAVYLLRRGFDPEKDLDKKPIKFENLEQIKQFLFEVTQKTGIVQTDDGNLSIIADIRASGVGGIVLKTPKATNAGGVYFKDEGLLQLCGDFASKTETVRDGNTTKTQSIMAVFVPPTIADEVLRYISQRWSVGAASHKTQAREMTGQVLPPWQPSNAINPDIERLQMARTSQFEQEKSASTITAEQSYLPVIDSNSSPVTRQNSVLTAQTQPPIKSIADSHFQQGASEKNIARLLHQAGLAAEILKESDFYLKVENKSYTPLSIERHGEELYLTHFLADSYGDKFIDAEMVFNISASGQLSLTQTATQNPFTGGESRYLDREFGKLFSKNLLDQGFAAAAQQALQAEPQVQLPTLPQSNASIPQGITQDITSVTTTPEQTTPLTDSSTQQSTKLDVTPIKQSSQKRSAPNSRVSKPTELQSSEQTLQLSLFDNAFNSDSSDKHLPTTSLGATSKSRLETTSPLATSGTVSDKQLPSKNVTSNAEIEKPTNSNNQPLPSPTAQNLVSHTQQQNEVFTSPMQVFQELVDRFDKHTGEYLATIQSSSPSVDTLREWYKASRELGKSQKYLDRITQVANEFKQEQVLSEKANTAMQQDLQVYYERAQIVAEVNGLDDRNFLLLQQSVSNYLSTAPTSPPSQTEIQSTQAEIAQINTKRENLFTEYLRLNDTINSAGNGFLRNFNREYKQAILAAEKVLSQIGTVLTQQEQKESQIIKWGEQAQAYQAWEDDPKTVQVQQIAQVLELPQMQERLVDIQQAIGQQEPERLRYNQQPNQHKEQRRR